MMATLLVLSCLVAVAVGSPFDGRIIGGNEGDIKNFPYQVSIGVRGSHYCGGAIIDENTILTAAHCTAKMTPKVLSRFTVRAGSTDTFVGGQVLKIRKFIVHEDFDPTMTQEHDIALLLLETPLKFGPGVNAIPLETESLPPKSVATVSGWGSTDPKSGTNERFLRYVQLNLISDVDCRKFYLGRDVITHNMICTLTPGKDACQGDSGGPMVIDGKLAGIVSWGLGCAQADSPGVYTKVSNYVSWIEEQDKN